MKVKNINKYFIFTIFILFLMLCTSTSIIADINKSNILNISSNKINIIKINSNGKISLINMAIAPEKENNIDSSLVQKLDELCKNDKKIQQLVNKYNFLPWVEVESKGYGFHKSFHRILWSNRTIFWRSSIKYYFYNDSDYTKGKFKGDEEWITITGSQRIRLVGFIGYVTFKPNFYLSRFKTHDIIIHGYTLRIDKLKLKNNID